MSDGQSYLNNLNAFCDSHNIDKRTSHHTCQVRTCSRKSTATMLIGVSVCTQHGDKIETAETKPEPSPFAKLDALWGIT